MTEYWKSNARKYCDFCKCWLADNKISISYHENGKRHKENVQNHITQVTKKSAKDLRQQLKVDDEMKKMEEAAMAAYLKDVQNNADLTSQSINETLKKLNEEGSTLNKEKDEIKSNEEASPLVWQEVKADDGNIYYWNSETNETTWDPPDKYSSLAEQEEMKKREQDINKKKKKIEEASEKQKQIETNNEVKAFLKREKMKEKAVKSNTETTTEAAVVCGPAPRADPYGTWAPVPLQTEETVDLQLPKSNKPTIDAPVIMEPEPVIKFKEKKVESLGEGNVDFKKRKLNINAKKNMRRKRDDDD